MHRNKLQRWLDCCIQRGYSRRNVGWPCEFSFSHLRLSPPLKLILSLCSHRYPAFNAGLILLFHISQQVLKGHHYDQFSEDIADARKCISALEYCAQDDEASRCYLVILRPFRELLSRSPGEAREMLQPPEPQCSPPTSPQSQWGSMYSVLGDIDGVSSSPPPNFSPTSSSPPNSSPSNTLDSTSTPVSSTKRMRFEYSSVHHNPRWTDFHSLPKVNVQQPSGDDGKRKYSVKDMEDLEALLRRVA